MAVHDTASLPDVKEKWWTDGFTFGDYKKEVDNVYKDAENVNIPIIWTLQYCAAKLKPDARKANLEQLLINLRKIANDTIMK